MPPICSFLSTSPLFTVFTAFFMHRMAYYTFYIFVVVFFSLLHWKFHKAGDASLAMTWSLYTVTSPVPRTRGWVLSELYHLACSRAPITYELYDLDAKSLCALFISKNEDNNKCWYDRLIIIIISKYYTNLSSARNIVTLKMQTSFYL